MCREILGSPSGDSRIQLGRLGRPTKDFSASLLDREYQVFSHQYVPRAKNTCQRSCRSRTSGLERPFSPWALSVGLVWCVSPQQQHGSPPARGWLSIATPPAVLKQLRRARAAPRQKTLLALPWPALLDKRAFSGFLGRQKPSCAPLHLCGTARLAIRRRPSNSSPCCLTCSASPSRRTRAPHPPSARRTPRGRGVPCSQSGATRAPPHASSHGIRWASRRVCPSSRGAGAVRPPRTRHPTRLFRRRDSFRQQNRERACYGPQVRGDRTARA